MELDTLDFIHEKTKEIGKIPLPDEMPRRQDLSQLPREILKSSTVENLISQNEDLMARLTVALRRLSILELENQKINDEANRFRMSQSATADQILIFKEKDNIWKSKLTFLEKQTEVSAEKVRAYAEQFKSLNDKIARSEAELERHRKYQERIKNQVKPYISQLKEYARAQDVKNQELTQEIEKREAQARDLRHQMIDVTKHSRLQVEMSEKKKVELTGFYEDQLSRLKSEVGLLQENQRDLELRSIKLSKALERQDQLENELVEMGRSKEDMRVRLDKEVNRLQERVGELSRHNQKLGIEHADLQVRVVDEQKRVTQLSGENSQLHEQIESLRYMWTAKNEEADKLKSALSSLEKLNLELSQKINDLRQIK